MPKSYLIAITQHTQECQEDLNELSRIAKQRPFNRIERRAAERALQVLIEASIGMAKYWLKSCRKNIPLDAYDSFNKLAEMGKLSTDELKQWRKIIGMRNALVHDYLAIDEELLQTLLSGQAYQFLVDFIMRTKNQLNDGFDEKFIRDFLPIIALICHVLQSGLVCVVVLTEFTISIGGKGIKHQSLWLRTVIIEQYLML